ncbi:helix-turn-helix domain-containing protein [Streptomyces xiaopingdaonensis]|uniref:helix-turn-helix domain-containing protein n=1 Tax=Streptomyces xiaopingdaonensis TaxID=1565415 RepID=UPI00037BDE38|nr:helix-turn-helix transcriptional regulator [Streptomyces xiaopingdaonensis]
MDEAAKEGLDGFKWFGEEVRAARVHAGMTQRELAEALNYQPPYVSKVESGAQLGSEQFARGCDRIFNTAGWFVRLRERVKGRGHPEWFEPYLKMEAQAASILDYSTNLIMGVLQTPEYASAVFRGALPRSSDEEIDERVQARRRRHEVLDRDTAPLLWVVLDECCLRRPIGGSEVMEAQLAHLLCESESPHVTVQVLPFASGAPPAAESFTLLTFADGTCMLYEEALNGGRLIDSVSKVGAATETYARLRADACSPEESKLLIRRAKEEHAR